MNSALRDKIANTAYKFAQKFGYEFGFKPLSGSEVTIWAFMTDIESRTSAHEGPSDFHSFTLIIPKQGSGATAFPAAAIDAGAFIRYPKTTGALYSIDDVSYDLGSYDNSATIKLVCSRYGGDA